MTKYTDIGVEKHGHVGLIEIQRPPLNFFDISLINQIADALEEFDKDIEIRASVLAAQGKAFCAGANFGDPKRQEQEAAEAAAAKKGDPADSLGSINSLYLHAVRIFRAKKPVVAAVHGAPILTTQRVTTVTSSGESNMAPGEMTGSSSETRLP